MNMNVKKHGWIERSYTDLFCVSRSSRRTLCAYILYAFHACVCVYLYVCMNLLCLYIAHMCMCSNANCARAPELDLLAKGTRAVAIVRPRFPTQPLRFYTLRARRARSYINARSSPASDSFFVPWSVAASMCTSPLRGRPAPRTFCSVGGDGGGVPNRPGKIAQCARVLATFACARPLSVCRTSAHKTHRSAQPHGSRPSSPSRAGLCCVTAQAYV